MPPDPEQQENPGIQSQREKQQADPRRGDGNQKVAVLHRDGVPALPLKPQQSADAGNQNGRRQVSAHKKKE